MSRRYELRRRAERQQETRRRIVEAAVELHTTIGPARTTVSAIAERAGVQRHTFYRHFPDERSLGLACSGLFFEQNPMPDPDVWAAIADPELRLRRGLGELYAYYEAHGESLAPILRDAEIDPLTREILELRGGAQYAHMARVLADGLPRRASVRAALELALDFYAWRRIHSSGLSRAQAVELMVAALRCQ